MLKFSVFINIKKIYLINDIIGDTQKRKSTFICKNPKAQIVLVLLYIGSEIKAQKKCHHLLMILPDTVF